MTRHGWFFFLLCACAVPMTACTPKPYARTQSEEQMFGPASMRIHPTFTQVKDWTGDGKPDGIEAVLEFNDQFDEPTRASGKVRFELWVYREADPERRGRQLTNPWTFSLMTKDEQVAHWNPAVRGYSFQLPFDKITTNHTYVLTAQVDLANGRLFDQLILEPTNPEKTHTAHVEHAPTNAPGHSR